MRSSPCISWVAALAAGTACSAQAIEATPTSGTLGTVVTVVSTDRTDARFSFNRTTRLQWMGVYQPPIGEPTGQVTISVPAADLDLIDPWTVAFTVGAGAISPRPRIDQLAGFGSFVGVLTATTELACEADLNSDGEVDGADLGLLTGARGRCPSPPSHCPADLNGDGMVDGADFGILLGQWGDCQVAIESPFTFGVDSNAARWEHVLYPGGFNGLSDPVLDGEVQDLPMYLLSLTPNPADPTIEQLGAGAGMHVAATLRIAENASSSAAAPATIEADLVSFDAQGTETDRRPVTLVLNTNDGDPKWLTYHNDLYVPILLIDTRIDPARFPQFVLLHGVVGGTATVVPALGRVIDASLPQPAPRRPPSQPEVLRALASRIAGDGDDRQDRSRMDGHALLEVIGAALSRDPRSAWREIRVTLEDAEATFPTKASLFRLALGEPTDLDQTIIDAVHAWGAAARLPAERQKPIEAWYLVRLLLEAAADDERWRDALAASPNGRDLLVWVAGSELGMVQSSNEATRLIVDLPVSAEERSDLALRVISGQPHGGAPHETLAPLLLPADIATLRTLFARSLDEAGPEPDSWPHTSAAATLAHLGDEESLPLMRRLAGVAGMRGAGERAAWYEQMINLQHPPSGLVAFLESDIVLDPVRSGEVRWALRRADQLGVDRQALRAAVDRAIARAGERPHAAMAVRSLVGNAIAIGLIDEAEVPKRLRPGPPREW